MKNGIKVANCDLRVGCHGAGVVVTSVGGHQNVVVVTIASC